MSGSGGMRGASAGWEDMGSPVEEVGKRPRNRACARVEYALMPVAAAAMAEVLLVVAVVALAESVAVVESRKKMAALVVPVREAKCWMRESVAGRLEV
jgi:hypothetical protein